MRDGVKGSVRDGVKGGVRRRRRERTRKKAPSHFLSKGEKYDMV